jgi:hypothetical protein
LAIEKKKKQEFISKPFIYIAIWRTYRSLLFDIVSSIVKAFVIAGHQFLYPCIIEWCCL